MKKISLSLLLACILFILPSGSRAITQNQISAEVQIVCPDNYGNWFSGSGTIIDSKGIILTNKHVVTDQIGGIIKTCFIGFMTSINQEPDFGSKTSPNLAEVKYYTTTNDLDAAILYLNNSTNISNPYINIWDSNSDNLKFGDKLEVIGFPSVGGSTITYTSGDFSGFGSKLDGTQNYIKTTAPLEHGNSGGSAYNLAGQFIGIPTSVVKGSLNSISYILSINSIKKWLNGIWGSTYQQKIIEQKPIIITPSTIIQNDITPPDINDVFFSNTFGLDCGNVNRGFKKVWLSGNSRAVDLPVCGSNFSSEQSANYESNSIMLPFSLSNFTIKMIGNKYESIDPDIKGIYAYIGKDFNAEPAKLSGSDYFDVASFSGIWDLNYYSGVLSEPGTYYIVMQAVDRSNNISNRIIWQYNYQPKNTNTMLKPKSFNLYTKKGGSLLSTSSGTSPKTITSKANSIYLSWIKNEPANYEVAIKEKVGSEYAQVWQANTSVYLRTPFLLNTSGNEISFNNLPSNKTYYLFFKSYNNDSENEIMPYIINVGTKDSTINNGITSESSTSGLLGRILLQVESKGEAWYVNLADGKRYYMADGAIAYQMMRKFGLGITNADLAKLPQEKEYKKYPSLYKNLKGKILLQVESHGEAWYVDPKTGYRYYMQDGEAAYSLMRFHSLGITNADLSKIPEGVL